MAGYPVNFMTQYGINQSITGMSGCVDISSLNVIMYVIYIFEAFVAHMVEINTDYINEIFCQTIVCRIFLRSD